MAVSQGYITSQNKRWQDANAAGDKDLMSRLTADSKRAGYGLDPYQAAVSSVKNSVTQPAATTQPTTVAASITPPQSRTNQTLDRLSGLANSQPFQYKAPDAFSYNQDTDPAYQAALASARANITQQQSDTNAQLRATGQGKSSYSETVANQIGSKEMARVSTDVLPQLISQAYQRYSDGANRDLQVQQANHGAQRDQVGDLTSLYGMQNEQDFSNPMAEAQITGSYLPGEAKQYINAILALKQQAEAPGITADARAGLSKQADAYRSALQGMGVDPSGFGAGVNASTAAGNMSGAGIQTLAGKEFDANQRQQNLAAALSVGEAMGKAVTPQTDYAGLYRQAADPTTPLNLAGQNQQLSTTQVLAQLTGVMPNGQPTTAEQQRQLGNLWAVAEQTGTIPDTLATMYGLPVGTQTLAAKQFVMSFNQSQTNADRNYLLAQDDNDRQWAALDNTISQQSGGSKYQGMPANQVLDNIKANYTDPVVEETDQFGKKTGVKTGGGITKDSAKRYQMFLDVIDSALPSQTAEDQVLLSLGFTKQEIAQMETKAQKEFGVSPKASSVNVPQAYAGPVQNAAKQNGVDAALIAAVIKNESSFDPKAKSGVGAAGLMQLMPGTAAGLGVTDPYDPVQNINGGTKYLSQMLKSQNSTEMALAAYNWGPGNLAKAIKQHGNSWEAIKKHAPKETQNYVSKVMKDYRG